MPVISGVHVIDFRTLLMSVLFAACFSRWFIVLSGLC